MKNIVTKAWIVVLLLSVYLLSADSIFAQTTPPDSRTLYNLGHAYSGAGRYVEAIEAFKQAIEMKPDAWTYFELGYAYAKIDCYQY